MLLVTMVVIIRVEAQDQACLVTRKALVQRGQRNALTVYYSLPLRLYSLIVT